MIDPRDIEDPARNYTVEENQPFGLRLPEYTFRQLVGATVARAVEEASKPAGFLDELYKSLGPDIVAKVKGFFRQHQNVECTINWPHEGMSLPLVAVVSMEESEAEDARFIGDRGGLMRTSTGPRRQKVIGVNAKTDVIVGTQDPLLTLLFHALVRYAFFSNKVELDELYDVHQLRISGRDMQWDAQLLPTFGYYKAVSLSYLTMFDYNLPPPPGFSLADPGIRVLADKDRIPTWTKVPGEE